MGLTFDNVWLHRGCMVNVVVSRLRVMMIIGVHRDGNGAGWDQSKDAPLPFQPIRGGVRNFCSGGPR